MSAPTWTKTSLSIPNDLSILPLVFSFVRQNALLRGFAEKAIQQIELGVEEAVSNVIQHAFQPGEQAEFMIICQQFARGIKITIRDKGVPFDPKVLPTYDPGNISENSSPKGLGWHLMEQSVDEVIFENLGREGKEVQLVKYLNQEPPEEAMEAYRKSLKKEPEPSFPPRSIPFDARKAKPSDAIEVTKCAYETYGYTYIFEPIYYPKHFGELMERGEILSVVAMTRDETPQLMAHNSLSFDYPEDKIALMGMTFTRKRYQNQGCGKKLGLLLVKEAIKKGIVGIIGTAITTHIYSQQGVYRAGVRTCGILLGEYPKEWRWKDFPHTGQRETAVLGYFKVPLTSTFRFRGPKKIAMVEHHREMIEKIFKNLERKFSYISPAKYPAELPEAPSSLSVQVVTYDKSAKIKVNAYGVDILDQTIGALKRLCQDKIEVIYLYLNMAAPYTAMLAKDFEAMGFFFAGIMPGPVKGDKLILQYLNNVKLDYEKIHLYSDFSKELLSYIKALDPNQG